ncbi:hypothetical protein BD779DRAFT_363540 [Infundibulicybe gibba]|nr:hypothetical protein BD779DRAFT_363540 [Infundibulicybe gibba]
MQFWIKKYPKGEVGRWLHTKNTGDQVEIRGPLMTWPWNEDAWDDIIMISGGTGITPFFQLFSTIIKNQPKVGHKTRYTLLHSSRTPADLPPPTIMEPLATFALGNPDIFRFHLFVDQNAISTPPASLDFQVGRIDKNTIIKYLAAPNSKGWMSFFQKSEQAEARKTLFLVCGPEPSCWWCFTRAWTFLETSLQTLRPPCPAGLVLTKFHSTPSTRNRRCWTVIYGNTK